MASPGIFRYLPPATLAGQERAAVFGRCTWAGALKDWDGPGPGQRPTAWVVVCAQAGKKSMLDLGIGEEHDVLLAIALGAPGEDISLEPLPEDGATAYWRDPEGGHHVPKRSLDDVLI